jgi:hypothetical protein
MKQKIKELVIPKILHTLETGGEGWFEKDFHFPLYELINCIEDEIEGMEWLDDFESNSNDWDWFTSFYYHPHRYCLSGSGWSGGLTFEKED